MAESLLYIESSPRKERSYSIKVANEFIKCYLESHPSSKTDFLDVWTYPLPEFNGAAINAKYKVLHQEKHTPEEATAWKRVTSIFEQFSSADKYVFSVPMWNFGIPYKLKHLIDIINQPSLSFSYSAETESYTGLVTGKPAVVIYSRGGAYSKAPADAFDFQKKYFEFILGFMGFKDIKSIVVEPTLGGPELVEKALKDAYKQAAKMAKTF
jgi:FMN-dependent NADH-azoreductase